MPSAAWLGDAEQGSPWRCVVMGRRHRHAGMQKPSTSWSDMRGRTRVVEAPSKGIYNSAAREHGDLISSDLL